MAGESAWAAVDDATDAQRLIAGLDRLRDEPFFAHAKACVAAKLPRGDGVRVLDVGCGTGEDAQAATAADGFVVAIDRSIRMATEALRRHSTMRILAADGRRLPLPSASVDAVRADRVLQHLADAPAALAEWRRVLRPGGIVVTFDPDLPTATVEGVDQALARMVLDRRAATRAGAATVHSLDDALLAAGFGDVSVERHTIELTSLDQADGIFGLAGWGASVGQGERWNDSVRSANGEGSLHYRCDYVLGIGRIGRGERVS